MEYRKPAMFVFLNKFGFNGLCRYNQKGKFNVPYGDARTPVIPEKEIRQFSEKLGSVGFLSADFRDIPIKSGDVVYCDPPFTSLDVNGFTSYASGGFGLDEHKKLVEMAEKSSVPFFIYNHDTEFTRELCKNAKVVSYPKRRQVSGNAEYKKRASAINKEIIATR